MSYRQLILFVVLAFLLVGWSNSTGTNTPVCTASGNQLNTQICAAKFGGTIITWEDSRGVDKDIYIQYLDASGQNQWKLNGIAACGEEGDQEKPQIVSDGAGGAIIAWIDKRGENQGKIYAQRVDASGVFLWGNNGTPVCARAGEKYKLRVVAAGEELYFCVDHGG